MGSGSGGFLKGWGMNDEMCSSTTSLVLSGFLYKIDLMFPTTCVSGMKYYEWLGLGGMTTVSFGVCVVITGFVIIIC